MKKKVSFFQKIRLPNFFLFIKLFLKKYLFLIGLLVFLYVPILLIVVFSFSDGKGVAVFGSFTLDNYVEMFSHKPFAQAVSTTLYVSIISTFLSVLVGGFGAAAIIKIKKYISNPIILASNSQLVMPDLLIGLSLFLFFTILNIQLGAFSLILAHISFCSPYVLVVMYPQIKRIDINQIYASYDLGAGRIKTFFLITLPQISGSLISATIISFIMSFDDFIISFFTSGTQNNISTFLFSLKRPSFIVNSFSSILLLIFSTAIFISSYFKYKYEKKKR